jgi:hypothetical protein
MSEPYYNEWNQEPEEFYPDYDDEPDEFSPYTSDDDDGEEAPYWNNGSADYDVWPAADEEAVESPHVHNDELYDAVSDEEWPESPTDWRLGEPAGDENWS